MKNWIRDYIWFIKESYSLMRGVYHPVIIFILSLGRGVYFCKDMKKFRKKYIKGE